jgi:hypothetical protein
MGVRLPAKHPFSFLSKNKDYDAIVGGGRIMLILTSLGLTEVSEYGSESPFLVSESLWLI